MEPVIETRGMWWDEVRDALGGDPLAVPAG